MTVTVFATIFLLLILIVTVVGFKTIIKRGSAPEDLNKERCTLCRAKYHRSQLIERQVDDTRLLYFCESCIANLYNQLLTKN